MNENEARVPAGQSGGGQWTHESFAQDVPGKVSHHKSLAEAVQSVETSQQLSHDERDWRIQPRGSSGTMTLEEAKAKLK